jgi:ectoine hydroxylase-related dioxygenase (phytanoyl-CoA dioxygenase family)
MNNNLEKIKKKFLSDGYCVVKNIISKKQCDFFLKTINKYSSKNYPPILNPDRREFLISQAVNKIQNLKNLRDQTKFLKDMEKDISVFRSFMINKKIMKILYFLKSKKVDPLMSQMIFKKAKTKFSKQSWQPHQDNSYIKNKNGHYITTNLFLKKSNYSNGTLYIWEKSHKEGLLKFKFKKSFREKDGKPGNIVKTKKKYRVKFLNFDKGDLLILHGNCVHGSHSNNSNRSRPLYSVSYMPVGEKFISGKNAQRVRLNYV